MQVTGRLKGALTGWNKRVIRLLRKRGLFYRLSTFFLLFLAASFFLTSFAYIQYTEEINLNLERYVSFLLQNTELKIQDTMGEYEEKAIEFYDDKRVIRALSQNALLTEKCGGNTEMLRKADLEQYDENAYIIENKLYTMRTNHRFIENIQFVTPKRQYHMVEAKGYQRGGTIRNLDAFYESAYYLKPQENYGYPVWMDGEEQSELFFKNDQSFYGIPDIVTLGISVYEPKKREFLGVLLLNINLDAFADSAEGYQVYNDENILLVGENGILMGMSPSITAPSFPVKEISYSEMLDKGQDITRMDTSGRKILLAYERIDHTGIFMTYTADLSVLLGRSYHIRNLCIAVLLCTVIACFIISYYITISISHPIRDLIHIMKKTGNGKWDVRYQNSGHDEITILGDRFNEMADKTNQLIDEVYLSKIRRQKTLLTLRNAQLEAMLMQINPHFLYNTLDIIRWEAMYEANGESRVTQMIEKFSRLCRMGMRTDGNTISLKEGLEHASIYLDVINYRHNDKISLEMNLQTDAEQVYIPQFLLQPVMENAVVHAFGEASKGCRIEIHCFIKEQVLHITVRDNGKGMDEEELKRLRDSLTGTEDVRKSIGLTNVHQRIRLFYGDAYGITIRSTFGQGSEIEIALPVREHSENMAMDKGESNTDEIPGIDCR